MRKLEAEEVDESGEEEDEMICDCCGEEFSPKTIISESMGMCQECIDAAEEIGSIRVQLASANALNIQLGLEKDRYKQLAIRERASITTDGRPTEESLIRAAEELDSEVEDIIIAEDGDAEVLRALIDDLVDGQHAPGEMDYSTSDHSCAIEMLARWLKQLGGQP